MGREFTLRLAEAGASVAFCDLNDAGMKQTLELAQPLRGKVVAIRANVALEDEVVHLMDEAQRQLGGLNALINNAGTTIEVEPKDLDAVKIDEWNRVFAVNVLGLFLVTRAAVALLRKSPNGCVVNTCSIAGLRPSAQPLPYAASKAAVANLTTTLAHALGPEIRVNAVAPGWMEGDWMKRTLAENYDGLMARRAKSTPLKRCCTADDVAETMMSLILGNRFVTGEIVVIDGGFSSTT